MKTSPPAVAREPLLHLQRRLERHFLTCSAVVGAAGALASAPAAKADIVYFNPADIQIPVGDYTGVYFNLETGQFNSDPTNPPDGWDINIFNYPANALFTFATTDDGSQVGVVGDTAGAYRYVSKLNQGTPINGSSNFLFGGVSTISYADPGTGDPYGGQWGGNTSGYIGITFELANGDQVFGWIGLDVIDSTNARVTDWAYETSGGQILAGVPEPGTMAVGFLAAGAVGLSLWRRRKAMKAACAAA